MSTRLDRLSHRNLRRPLENSFRQDKEQVTNTHHRVTLDDSPDKKTQVSEGSTSSLPRWIHLINRLYSDWGLKPVCLFAVLFLYQFFGACVFYLCEASNHRMGAMNWAKELERNRSLLVRDLVGDLDAIVTNGTDRLTWQRTAETLLRERLVRYEGELGVRYSEQKLEWNFWNAMLYALSVYTTIGYGNLYATTPAGRLATMLYSIFGIPLVLSILDDLGRTLTRVLKTPWYLLKCGCRRIFRSCTKQTLKEIRELDTVDRRELKSPDLPLSIALLSLFGWVIICAASFCVWERDWDFFLAFYFFFMSLSTIGLGGITPSEPKYLLILSLYIVIGLSLVSITANLIQSKFHRGETPPNTSKMQMDDEFLIAGSDQGKRKNSLIQRNPSSGSSLGLFRSKSQQPQAISRETYQAHLRDKPKQNKSSQTVLSFPSPARNSTVTRTISQIKLLPRSLSIDDVMRLVDTEEGDILLLTELTRMTREETSGISESSRGTTTSDTRNSSELGGGSTAGSSSDSSSQMVISRSFDAFGQFNLPPAFLPQTMNPLALPSIYISTLIANARAGASATALFPGSSAGLRPTNLTDLELLEELEDRMLLSHGSVPFEFVNPSVHFRSRLSLIPEQRSVGDEEAEISSPGLCSSASLSDAISPIDIDQDDNNNSQTPCTSKQMLTGRPKREKKKNKKEQSTEVKANVVPSE